MPDGTLRNAARARINPDKIYRYALNPDHPRGGDKALVFERVLGYNRGNAAALEVAIREGSLSTPAQPREDERHGPTFIVDLVLHGPSGREAVVRTEWIYEEGEEIPSLSTVFIRRRRKRGQTSTP